MMFIINFLKAVKVNEFGEYLLLLRIIYVNSKKKIKVLF